MDTNFIQFFQLPDTNICDKLIDFFNKSDNKKEGCVAGYKIDKEIKNSIDISDTELPQELRDEYYSKNLHLAIQQYIATYEYSLMNPFGFSQSGNIQYYPPGGGFYKWHCERSNVHPLIATRHLVWMTYLNDVTDDGETEFYYQKLKVKPIKGLTLIFPADWTHTHRGIPSMTQDKYIITGWLHYLESK